MIDISLAIDNRLVALVSTLVWPVIAIRFWVRILIAPILRGFPFFVKAGEAKYRCIGMTITKNNIYQIPRRDEDENSSGRGGNLWSVGLSHRD